jgi:hypothetical protein
MEVVSHFHTVFSAVGFLIKVADTRMQLAAMSVA